MVGRGPCCPRSALPSRPQALGRGLAAAMAGPALPLPPPLRLPGSPPQPNEGVRLEGGLRRGQDRVCVLGALGSQTWWG